MYSLISADEIHEAIFNWMKDVGLNPATCMASIWKRYFAIHRRNVEQSRVTRDMDGNIVNKEAIHEA